MNLTSWIYRQHRAIRRGRLPADAALLLELFPLTPTRAERNMERWRAALQRALASRSARGSDWLRQQQRRWHYGHLDAARESALAAAGLSRDAAPEHPRLARARSAWSAACARARADPTAARAREWVEEQRARQGRLLPEQLAALEELEIFDKNPLERERCYLRWAEKMAAVDAIWLSLYDAVEAATRTRDFGECLLREKWFPLGNSRLETWVREERAVHRAWMRWLELLDARPPASALDERFRKVERLNEWRW